MCEGGDKCTIGKQMDFRHVSYTHIVRDILHAINAVKNVIY